MPTPPSGTMQQPRNDDEYVYGKGAAIQRFKDMQHGVDNADMPFSDSGIIAFVKDNDFDFWFEKVNQWVYDAQWDATEQLQKVSTNSIATLLSAHSRTDTTMIRLHHFWVYVQKIPQCFLLPNTKLTKNRLQQIICRNIARNFAQMMQRTANIHRHKVRRDAR